MNKGTQEYVDFTDKLSKAIRETIKATGISPPKSSVLIVPYWGGMEGLDSIMGFKVMVADTTYDSNFILAFDSDEVDSYKFLKEFNEQLLWVDL